MTLADVRVPHARWIVLGAGVAVCTALLWWTRTFTFYFDEWTFITTAPDWTLRTYFEPHNEHPAILLRVLYTALLDTAGLRTYVPYMAAVLIAHLANVALLFELVRRRAGEAIALVAALILLVLGAGWEDLLWAFQAGWLASVAFGLGALLVLERRPWLAAMLLAVSLAFTGIGVTFAVAAVVQLGLTPGRRRDVLWLVPVAVALLAWYIAFGRFGAHPDPPPTAANLYLIVPYVLWGLGQGVAGIVGETGWIGLGLLAAAAFAVAWRTWRHGIDPFNVAIAAALVAMYLVTGLTRAQLGYQQSGASRYTYVGAALWLILLGDAARRLPWRGTWRPALAACAFLACFNSAALLVAFAAAKSVQMERAVADLQALAAVRHDPCLDPAAGVDPLVMPYLGSPALYYRAVQRYGDPVAGLPVRDRTDFEAALADLRKANC